ncbi:MAG: gamma-glutamyl-gamma-aminobutyrate hydrolase family protein [Aeromonas sp.]
MSKQKVFIVGGHINPYGKMFADAGWHVMDTVNEKVEDADLVQFTGGADVSPKLYHEAKHPRTFCSEFRDDQESAIYDKCIQKGIPMAGICRGGQFLNVMNGGRMYQDVDGHAIGGHHAMVDLDDGSIYQVTSTHHQMMRPSKRAIVLAVASNIATRKEYCDINGAVIVEREDLIDVEVVIYKDSKCLCFQPHPEYGIAENSCRKAYFRYLNLLLAA